MLTSLKLMLIKATHNPILTIALLLAPIFLAIVIAFLMALISMPLSQSLSIAVLALALMLFPTVIRDFKKYFSSRNVQSYTDEDWLRDIKRREYRKGYSDGQMMS